MKSLEAVSKPRLSGWRRAGPLAVALLVAPTIASAQTTDPFVAAVDIARLYQITPNITYLTANNWEAKLDVYRSREATTPNRTLIYIHGGGWTGGSKEQSALTFLPFLQMGWNVVNVEYRLARVSLAPAAVEDCLCALRWVYRNAKQYNIDTTRLVVSGGSAGAHLALTSGMIPPGAGLDRQCPGTEELKVAAIINWYGITDVVDLLDGPNMKVYAVTWLGSMSNREEIARRVSPLTYVRPGLPPVLTIHGDADPTVPYSHALRLRDALDKARVPNQLVTVPGGRHGGFSQPEMVRIYTAIRDFVGAHLPTERTSR
jgi:acetyl esterase/lipase